MNYSVLGLGAGGWQVWSLHNSLRSVSEEAYKWGKETMMKKKESLLWKRKNCSRHPGTMHWCAVALNYLICTLWYNEITVMLLACRYWSLKPYLTADKFQDLIYLIYMKQNFLTQLGTGWEKKKQPWVPAYFKPNDDMMTDRRLEKSCFLVSRESDLPSRIPCTNITPTPDLRGILSQGPSLVSEGQRLPQIVHWVVLECAHLHEPWAGHFCWPGKKGDKAT